MGGNIFEQTSSIKKELIEHTLKQFFLELHSLFPKLTKELDRSRFINLGSTGKREISNDIDLGVDVKSFKSVWDNPWNLDRSEVLKTFFVLEKRARTSNLIQLQQRAWLIELGKFINGNSELIQCDIKKITSGFITFCFPQFDDYIRLDSYVQIDIMLGDIDWLKFTYYNEETNPLIRGLHITQAKLALFKLVGFTYSHTSGIKDCVTNEFVTNDPIEALELLSKELGVEITLTNSNSFSKIINILSLLPTERFHQWLDIYLKILDSTRCDIPLQFQQEWLNRCERLNLQGKFLPKDSNLYEKR